MNELRIPKRRTPVELTLVSGGPPRNLAIFLSDFAAAHAGAERVSDLLNGEADFFPAVSPETDETLFFQRRAIAVVRVDAALEPDVLDEQTLPSEHLIELVLVNGGKLTGTVSYVRPPDRARICDFLNDGPLFFPLFEEAGRVALVNKMHVAELAEKKP